MGRRKESCLVCRHFRNSPRYLEAVFKGLSALSSGYASVRKDDGICLERDLYLSADNCCAVFATRDGEAPAT